MTKRIVTFGEVLLRFSKDNYRRLQQGSQMNGNYGGSEANVAVSLALLGNEIEYVSRVPANQLGQACLNELRYYGVDVSHVVRGGERLGTYYFESAAGLRNSQVVYDRQNSSFYSSAPGMFPWHEIFAKAQVFHCSGITCSVSQSATDATFEAVRTAREMGLTVCCDINYRKNLWRYGAEAHPTLHRLLQYSDFIFGDQGEYEVATGMPRVPFKAADAQAEIDMQAYGEWFERVQQHFPQCKRFILAMRNQISSTHHTLTGLLYTNGQLLRTRIYDINPVLDPMGVGDAFVAAYVHASLKWPDNLQRTLDFALAASQLKNSVKGDFNLVSEEEIVAQM